MKKIRIGFSKDINLKINQKKLKSNFEYINYNKFYYDAIIVSPNYFIDYNVINKSKNLKVIFIMSLHLISQINLRKINPKIKILWFNKKNKNVLAKITPTPEFIFGLIILLAKNFLGANHMIKEKKIWNPKTLGKNSFPLMLSEATLGIIGYGRIGKQLFKYAKKFGMKILIFSNKKHPNQTSLKTIAEKSDFISVNLSLKKSTKNFINKKFFKLMKKNSYFINTSKGEIVNYLDLLKFLGKNINAAAIDVYKNENSNDKELKKLSNYSKKYSNLILTPHIAGGTLDSIQTLQKLALTNINSYLKSF